MTVAAPAHRSVGAVPSLAGELLSDRDPTGRGSATELATEASLMTVWTTRKSTTIIAVLATGTVLLTACGSAKSDPIEPAAPAMADPISPSLDTFVDTWNDVTSHLDETWNIDELPPVDQAGTFDVDLSDELQLTGVLNPSTDRVVEMSVILKGTEVGTSSGGQGGQGRDHEDDRPHDERAAPHRSEDHHGSTEAGGDHHGPTGAGGDHHGAGPPTVPVEFDVVSARNAISAMIRSTSAARPEDVDAILHDLGVDAAAELPASEAGGEAVEITALERNLQLQRFPTLLIVAVRAEEPWEFPQSRG
jgi:hypothetical protein